MVKESTILFKSNNNRNYYQKGLISNTIRKLLDSFHGLVFKDIPINLDDQLSIRSLRVDLKQTTRAKTFLVALEETADVLKLPMVSRYYRSSFTRNYRALMPTNRRMYRVDVLEAGQQHHRILYVNSQRYYMGDDVAIENRAFGECWFKLLNHLREIQSMLDRSNNKKTICGECSNNDEKDSKEGSNVLLSQSGTIENENGLENIYEEENDHYCQYCEVNWLDSIGLILIEFDKVWTNFERCYILELIGIESHARKPIMVCIYTEEELQLYEGIFERINSQNKDRNGISASRVLQVFEKFVHEIGMLNSVANVRAKGRQDFDSLLFQNALMIMNEYWKRGMNCLTAKANENINVPNYDWIEMTDNDWITELNNDEIKCLKAVAEPLINELMSLRIHLRELGKNPDKIDPHLIQNRILENHLKEFECKWEIVNQWIRNKESAKSITEFVLFICDIIDYHPNHTGFSTKRLRVCDQVSNVDVPRPSQSNVNNGNSFDSFEERINSLDVSALVALPRLIILFFIINPKPNTPNYHLIHLLLPNDVNPNLTINGTTSRKSLPGAEFFFKQLQDSIIEIHTIPDIFRNVIISGAKVATLCHVARNTPGQKKVYDMHDLEDKVFEYLLERFINNDVINNERNASLFDSVKGLTSNIDRFYNAIEEVSILLQRRIPHHWNSFLYVVVHCLQSVHQRSLRSNLPDSIMIDEKSNSKVKKRTSTESSEERTPKSERVLEGSPTTMRGQHRTERQHYQNSQSYRRRRVMQ